MLNQPSPPANDGEPHTSALQDESAKLIATKTAEPATARQLTKVEERMTGFERSTLRWAKIAVLMSALAAAFVCAQWYEMHTGGADTHELAVAAHDQAGKMKDMSEAADKIREAAEGMVAQEKRIADNGEAALESANNQAILSQRAWMSTEVALDDGGKPPTGDPFVVGKSLKIRILFKNTGRTPALSVRTDTHAIVSYPENGTFEEPPRSFKPAKPIFAGNIPPDSPVMVDIFEPMTAHNKNLILTEKARISVVGRVKYRDVFGTDHWYTSCHYMLPTGAFGICAKGNQMDNNQTKKP